MFQQPLRLSWQRGLLIGSNRLKSLLSTYAACKLTGPNKDEHQFIIDKSEGNRIEVSVRDNETIRDLKNRLLSKSADLDKVEFCSGPTYSGIYPFDDSTLIGNLKQIFFSMNDGNIIKVENKRLEDELEHLMDEKCCRLIDFYRELKNSEQNLQDLQSRRSQLLNKLDPLNEVKLKVESVCDRHLSTVLWSSLAYLAFQIGILARWTWYEYSWDIVEPMTYFIGYSSVIGYYAFFILSDKDFNFFNVSKSIYLSKFYKVSGKMDFDVKAYNQLCENLKLVEDRIAQINKEGAKLIEESRKELEINQVLFQG
ncbi:hypothetical protein ACOME3_000230 [Neoechinorhynchus agilis]